MVFAKAPIPGEVKTRLIPALGPVHAAELHKCLTTRIVATTVQSGLYTVDLWCSPSSEDTYFQWLQQRYSLSLHRQVGPGLGDRMAFAFQQTLKRSPLVVIVGTDCPVLTADVLNKAFEKLTQGEDAVIAPAEDGGYVLLGLRRYSPYLFENIAWGTSDVMNQTKQRLIDMQWRWSELETFWDVDRPEDLKRLGEISAFVQSVDSYE